MTERWYEFTAYNQQIHYGFGTAAEADKYCDILNRGRTVGLFHAREMADDETTRLDSGHDTDGFRLDLELDAQAEVDEVNAAEAPRGF